MKKVAKYNLCKAVSTVLTVGTPIATLACCGEFFIHRSETAISAAAIFAFLLSLLFIKDKLFEFLKSPTALKVAIIGFVFCIAVQNLIVPLQWVFGMTIIACVIDELTFKRWCKIITYDFPLHYEKYSHFGFLWCKTKTLDKLEAKHE